MSEIKLNIILNNGKTLNLDAKHTDKWSDIKEILQHKLNESPKNIVLLGPTSCTNDDDLIKDYNLNENSIIYCFIDKAHECNVEKLNYQEISQLKQTLSSVSKQSNFEDFIMKMRSLDKISQLVSEYPSVSNDPEIVAILQEASLISAIVEDKDFDSIIDQKPLLGRLLQILCTLIKSEGTPPKRTNIGSYALDEMSDDDDDDDMDMDQDEESGESSGTNRSIPSLITPAQLAAALANASGSSPVGPRSGLTTPSSTSTPYNTPGIASTSAVGSSPGGSVITSDMFSQALQNALTSSSRRSGTTSTTDIAGSSGEQRESRPDEYVESLELMREMGISDDAMSLTALQATNGDVQAAVNLIFAQLMSDE